MENNPTVAGGRIVWLDVVRLVAMFTVVCCHCTDPFNFYSGDSTAELDRIRFWGAAWGAALRPCVPLFVMITGALLLPVRDESGPFCRKVNVRSVKLQGLLANLTLCGFGVYMVHYFLTGPSVALMRTLCIPVWLQIPAAAIVAFALSWLIVWGIRILARKKARYIVG